MIYLVVILLAIAMILLFKVLGDVATLRVRLNRLEQQYQNTLRGSDVGTEPAVAPKAVLPAEAEPLPEVRSEVEVPPVEATDEEVAQGVEVRAETTEAKIPDESDEPEFVPPVDTVPEPPMPDVVAARKSVEENLASKWFIWVGGLAIVIAGLFLVKYFAERGILTIKVRMILAFAMGVVLTLGGEWVRRRPISLAVAAIKTNYVPLALTAAGLLTMYAAVYASYALYNLLSPLVAFGLLAIVSASAFALSTLQGPVVAGAGLAGAFVTPALVSSNAPSAIGLFGYLAIVNLAIQALVRIRPWAFVGYAAIGLGAAWVAIWTLTNYAHHRFDAVTIGLYLVLVMIGYGTLALNARSRPVLTRLVAPNRGAGFDLVALLAVCAGVVVFVLPMIKGRFSDPELFVFVGLVLVAAGVVYIRPRLELVLAVAVVAILGAFALWALGTELLPSALKSEVFSAKSFFDADTRVTTRHVYWSVIVAVMTGGIGYWVLVRHPRVPYWAAFTIGPALGLLIIAYAAFKDRFGELNWVIAGLVFTTAAAVASVMVMGRKPSGSQRLLLGLFASSVVAGVSLTLVFFLRDAWLTVALSLQLPAIALIAARLNIPFLRHIALAIAAALFLRLAANPFVVQEYWKTAVLGDHWVLYGYGVPAVAAHFAAQWFRAERDDRLVTVLEGLRIIFAILLVSAEIRNLVAGGYHKAEFNLLEAAMQSIAWLAVSWSRIRQFARDARWVDKVSGNVLLAMGLLMAFGGSLLILNPVLTHEFVGKWPVVDTLLLAFAAPAGILWAITKLPMSMVLRRFRAGLEAGTVILAFAYITFEVRHWFQGAYLDAPDMSMTERALHCIAWLTFAGGLFWKFSLTRRWIDRLAGRVVLWLGIFATVVISLLLLNPVFTGEFVGSLPVINNLALAYLVPALVLWVIALRDFGTLGKIQANAVAVVVAVLVFAYVTLETRHVFQGPRLNAMSVTDAEQWAYSAVWLVFAIAILMYGLLFKRAVVRYAALVVLVIAVLKVFLYDMAGLEGLWRVASFLGLGLSLVGIGFLYQRFLYAPKPADTGVAKDA